MIYDAIIIGAGASGLYCAAHLTDKNVLVIEKNKRIGLKVLASGSGQCNLTHGGYMNAFFGRYGANKAFVKPALSLHANKDVVDFFEGSGVKCFERPDGKVFPVSLKASDVVDALKGACRKATFKMETRVISCEKAAEHFVVKTDHGDYISKALVLATGGRSYPSLGTTGDGYAIAEAFGHTIVPTKPGLTGVVTRGKTLTALQGVSLDGATMTLTRHGQKSKVYEGALLFTHFGLSGPVVINNSRDFDRGDTLMLNFLASPSDVIERQFIESASVNGDKPIAFYLNQLKIPEVLKSLIMADASFDRDTKLSMVTKQQRKWLVQQLTAYACEIESLIGYQQAMVTVGGVLCAEVDAKTLESRLEKGLYIIGEVLDVDGDTGGYNLQWAFSSGYAAAKKIQNDNVVD
jgi:hypothetical protein